MTPERTLLIIKPDVAGTPEHVRAILIRVLAAGLTPLALQRSTITKAQAESLYEAHAGQSYHARNVEFMTSEISMQVVLEGEKALARLRDLIGMTDPSAAKKADLKGRAPGLQWSLRAQFGTDLPRNAVHGSASAQEAEREIKIFFPTTESPCPNCGGDGLWCCYKSEQFQRLMKDKG